MTLSVRIHAFGGPEVLSIEDVDIGAPGPAEALIRIHAIGLNRTEITLRSGRSPRKPQLPTPIGFEAAGIVEAVGSDVSTVSVGDRVAMVPAYPAARYGLYGQAAIVPADVLVPVPDDMDFVGAAAVWAAFGTAWAGLASVGGLRAGQTVLISAASSSVGLSAMQIARRLGAVPIALSRTDAKRDALIRHGAEEVLGTTDNPSLAEAVRALTGGLGADLAFDPVGGPGFATIIQAVRDGGTAVLYGAMDQLATQVPAFDIFARDITVRGVSLVATANDPAKRAAMTDFVATGLADGSLTPVIDRTFPFDRIVDAHRHLETGEQIGKIVVTV